MTEPHCIFCRIVRGELPTKRIFEDDEILVFPDINPAAPVHLLMVPKTHVATLDAAGAEHERLLGKMLLLAPRLAREQGATNGFRIVINNGPDGGQEVYHLHVHVLGGPRPWKRL
ncbi:histidine triad nucleotide-binding protein [Betaproteobacteria bacterium PRO7]|jgi:histidine triad (HIT) family protein|nr:histidine triad nucleotide-binding protein [Betaproteobacteria bacterium PRO7]